jgi:5-methylcytosine-specific restriction endonuclease McrA
VPYKNPADKAAANRRWAEANPDKVRASAAKQRAKNPPKPRKNRDLEKRKVTRAAWRAANPDKVAAVWARNRVKYREKRAAACRTYRASHPGMAAAYYAANRTKLLAWGAAYRKANPGKTRAAKAKRRALEISRACSCCTTKQISDEFYSFVNHGFTEIDHITPLALGGLHCRKNLQLLTVLEHKAKTKLDRTRIAEFRRSNKISPSPARVA